MGLRLPTARPCLSWSFCEVSKSLSNLFPPTSWDVLLPRRKSYSTDMSGPGYIRPWQCSWRSDFGVSAMVDPDQAENLMQIYLQEGLPCAFTNHWLDSRVAIALIWVCLCVPPAEVSDKPRPCGNREGSSNQGWFSFP